MAWSEGRSARAERLPADWQTRRLRVLRRDGYRCQARLSDGGICGERGSDVDHVVRGDDHALENLRTLCRWHHAQKSAREGAEARTYARRARDPEPHPGEIL